MAPCTRLRCRAIALVASAVSLVSFATPWVPRGVAQGQQGGTFAISPARRDVVARPPVTLAPTLVSNTTRDGYDVRAFPVLLRQDLTGAFQFNETPRELNAAGRILDVAPSRFRLVAGQSRQVALRWGLLPRGTRAVYVGVVFQGQAQRSGKSVPVVSRLLSINFLRRPGRYHATGAFRALHAVQFAPRVLRFLPRVANNGDIVAAPQRGRLVIRDAGGDAVHTAPWVGDVILPGAQREFPVDVHRVLPAGRYTVTATMRFGANRHAKITRPVTLVGPNVLPTPSVRISDFAAHGRVGKPAQINARIQSTGTAPAQLDLNLSLFRVTGGQPNGRALATRQLHYAALAPGSARALKADLTRRLASGRYHVVARYTDPAGVPQQLTSDFAATSHRGFLDRFKRFLDRHGVLIVSVIALLASLLLVALMLRRQRRLEHELRAARAEHGDDIRK